MSLKRIHAVPPPAHPPHSIPLYGLPTSDVTYSARSLAILRGGITLGQYADVDSTADVNLKNESDKDDRLGFRFTVKNPKGNPTAQITDFTVGDNILLFQAFNTSDDPTGDIITAGDSFDLCFFTTFALSELNQGVNTRTGTWTLGNTFAGFEDIEEEYIININYRIIVAFENDNTKDPSRVPGKLRSDVFVDEYVVLNKREPQSFDGGKAINPG